jgi:hypothetical protein
MKNIWWLHFAQIGVSVGGPISAICGMLGYIPGPVAMVATAIGGVAAIATHFAASGVAAAGQ